MKASIINQPINNYAELKRQRQAANINFGTLLGDENSNPKIKKNQKQGVLSKGMNFAPSNSSGKYYGKPWNVCPSASPACIDACLHTAGNPVYMEGKIRARLERTKMFFTERDLFCATLVYEIRKAERKAELLGMQCGIRLNATSDIRWELLRIDGQTLMEIFPDVEFYDYTAEPNRKTPSNLHLTFSLKENNLHLALKELKSRRNVAVVFDTPKGKPLPETWQGFKVIDGDVHDFRPLDPEGVVVGLRAKGDAIGDTTGFVQKVWEV